MDKEMLDALAQMMDSKLKELVQPINERLDRIEEDTRHTRVLVEAHDEKFQLIQEAQAETAAKFGQLDRMEQTLNDVKSEVEVIRDVVRSHSSDIAMLKRAL